jgi:hypothetical protein
MPRYKKATPRNLKKVFDNILAMDNDAKVLICEKLNEALDDLLNDDYFGTEGQNDPRGDQRS